MRRVSLALLVSVGVHAGIAVSAVGISVWRGLSFARDVEVVPITVEVKELPLGPPPAATKREVAIVAPPPRRPRVAPQKTGSLPTENRDAGAPDAKPAPPPPEARPATPPK